MCPTREGLSNLVYRIKEAVSAGATEWYWLIRGRKRLPISDEDRLENTICIYQALTNDLKTVLSVHEPTFQSVWQISAFSLVYLHYDQKLENMTKFMVLRIKRSLKSVKISKEEMILKTMNKDEVSSSKLQENLAPQLYLGTALFELYLSLQKFHKYLSIIKVLYRLLI